MRPEIPDNVVPVTSSGGLMTRDWYLMIVLLMAHIDALEARIQALENA